MGAMFSDENEPFHCVKGLLLGISPDELEAVLRNGSDDWIHASNEGKHMGKNRNSINKEPGPHLYVMRSYYNFVEHPVGVMRSSI
jgi:hypothetical protein